MTLGTMGLFKIMSAVPGIPGKHGEIPVCLKATVFRNCLTNLNPVHKPLSVHREKQGQVVTCACLIASTEILHPGKVHPS